MPNLRPRARDLLIEYLDGRHVPIIRQQRNGHFSNCDPDVSRRNQSIGALLKQGWIKPVTVAGKAGPIATVITEAGRQVISEALADWADALDRARIASDFALDNAADSRLNDRAPVQGNVYLPLKPSPSAADRSDP
jgi:hypothetical protein